jgi:hypothetical protein
LIRPFPVLKNLFDPHVEQPRDPECQGQRRIVLAGLDRIDRLARHPEAATKLGLAPGSLCSKDSQPIVHDLPFVAFA